MPFAFGTRSLNKLDTCHPLLRSVAMVAIERSPYDFTIVHGWRGEEVQDALFESGASKKRWPDSEHNRIDGDGEPEATALDFAPWIASDIPWNDTHIFAAIAGVFMAVAAEQGVVLRWGGDWDSDGSTKDQTLMDWGHLELA